jgi:ribosomal protein L37AE/L43A
MTINTMETRVNPVGTFLRRFLFRFGIVLITIQFAVLVSWGWSMLLFWNHVISGIMLKVAVVIGTGLSSGLLARIILNRHWTITKWLVATASMCASLAGLYRITYEGAGFSLQSLPVINWDGLWQLAAGSITSLVSILAWKPLTIHRSSSEGMHSGIDGISQTIESLSDSHWNPINASSSVPVSSRNVEPRPVGTHTGGSRKSSGSRSSRKSNRNSGNGRGLSERQARLIGANTARRMSRNRSATAMPGSIIQQRKGTGIDTITRSRMNRIRRKPIRLVGREEHRCPYCLDKVSMRDPAGVIVCPICHTAHHKQCWNVTGTCQVPHIQG